jgi:hypothetical protein
MKKFRKDDHCLNCGTSLMPEDNYCATCGQKNNHNDVLLGTLLKEYLAEGFSFDSRIIKSIRPFFLNPGYLTRQFNAGRRVSFINPVRLYLVMSLIYFFVLSLFITENINLQQVLNAQQDSETKSVENLNKLDSLGVDLTQLDSLGVVLNDPSLDSLSVEIQERIANADTADDNTSFKEYMAMFRDPSVADEQLLDSLGMDNNSTNLKFVSQARKVVRKDLDVFLPFLLQNVPLMMLLLLPIFAAILKLLYIRRKVLYIRHLVHGLYLHSFAYLIYALSLLAVYYLNWADAYEELITTGAFILVSTYTYISFLKVYQQGWFKTLIKFWMVGWLYSFFLFLFTVGEFLISFWFF